MENKLQQYQAWYQQSISEPEQFWAEKALEYIDFDQPWTKVSHWNFKSADIRWFEGAKLNVAKNCVDRHLASKANKPAILFEGDEPGDSQTITYQQLHEKICQLANALEQLGIQPGDRVCLYLPMIPEAVVAMLACARIGAIHTVVFAGFSPQALHDRLVDADCKLVITAMEGKRGGKSIPLKLNVDEALAQPTQVTQVLVINNTTEAVKLNPLVDLDYEQLVNRQPTAHQPPSFHAEDPLFILYTSGSTGQPKGVLHTQAGYLLYASFTFDYVFDYKETDVFWCTADVGWVTGHSYLVYGPLSRGATIVLHQGTPFYPSASRCWEIIDKYQVTTFYTAPTAIRALMAAGEQYLNTTKRDSLRVLGTVGEPINKEAWLWYKDKVGHGQCPIMDTWWQTETGGIVLAPFMDVAPQTPGCAGLPFFGIVPEVVDDKGQKVGNDEIGHLILKQSWPGQMRTVFGNHKRCVDTYFRTFLGQYYSGDEAQISKDNLVTILGRADDVMNVSGHRISTAEVESAMTQYLVAVEAAVVGVPDEITGTALVGFAVLSHNAENNDSHKQAITQAVIKAIGKFAKPKSLYIVSALPKTRSGKIMRRLLRKIAVGDVNNLGDISTLADTSVVTSIYDAVHDDKCAVEAHNA